MDMKEEHMKRLNEKTGVPFKFGDTREDGHQFDHYDKTRIKKNGFYREIWRNEKNLEKERLRKSDNKNRMTVKVKNVIDKIKIGDLSFLDDLPEKTRIEVEKIGILIYNGCTICGHDNPKHLDFHHRIKASKEFSIGNHLKTSWQQFLKIYREMSKCDVYCAHHHRDVERINRSTIKEKKAWT